MVRFRAHAAAAALLLLAASVSADLRPRSGGESGDALALIQRSLKSESEVGPQRGAAGKSPKDMTPEERQKDAQKKKRKIEKDAKAKGCPAGYSLVAGDVAGGDQFGRDGRHKTDTVELCAEDCASKPECRSFEWSPNVHTCNANKEAPAKFEKPHQDFMLCVLNATQGPPAAPAAEGSPPSNGGAALAAAADEAASSQAPPKEEAAPAAEQPGARARPEGEAAGAVAKPEGEAEAAAPAPAKAKEEDPKPELSRYAPQESSQRKAEEEEGVAEELKRREAERKAKEAAERAEAEKAEQEAERLRRKEAARKAEEEEAERAEKEKAARKVEEKEEAERLKKQQEAERKAREEEAEAERLKQQEAERKAKEEAERAEAEEATRKAEEEAEKLKQQEVERKAKEERERAEAEEAARKTEEEAERLQQEEAERKARQTVEDEAEEEDEAEPKAAPEAAELEGEEAEGAREVAEPSGKSAAKAEKEVKLHRVVEAEAGEREADRAKEQAARQEAERLEQEEAERKAREEARKAKELADHKARQEAELKAKAEAEKLEKEKAKQEADRKAKEAMCSTGYHFVDGDVPGWDQFGHDNVRKANINLCRRACDSVEECLSYEWSPTTKICSLNKDHQPSLGRFEDYVFCQRSQAHLDKLAAKRKAAEEQAARLASEREAAAQVAKAESDQELQGLRELAAHEARSRLEREERRKAEEAQRLAEEEAEKERKARELEEARKEAEIQKDLINIDEAAAADEEEERQKLEKQKAEEEAARLEAEEQARKKAEEEAAQQRKIEEEMEAERRAQEEATRLHEEEEKRQAEEEARAKAEEEAKQQEIIDAVRRAEEMEQQSKVDELAQQEAAAEAARKAEEEKKRQEEEQKKAEEEARLQELEKTDPVEAATQRRRAEVKAKMAAALERKRLMLEKKRKKEEAQGKQIKALEDEIKERQKEEAERRLAEETAARKREAEEQARREAEQAAAVRAVEEAREREEAERARHSEAEESVMEKKVMAASRPFEAESLAEPAKKAPQIALRVQATHGKIINLKVSRTVRFKVMMHAACGRLGISEADAQFTHGGRHLKSTDTPESFGLAENDLVKVDDFIKVDDLLAEEENKDEDAAAKAAREMFEAAQREWEGGKAKDTVVELTAAEKAQISERDTAEMRKWQASMMSALRALPAPRSAEEARSKAKQVVSQLSEEEIAGLIYGTDNNAKGYYVGNTRNVSRFEIPNLRVQDVAYRYKKFFKGAQKGVTCWPSALALASTWDEQLVGRVGGAMAVEMRGKGANVMIGPSVSVLRVASGGRNFEQLSGEDPYLGARLVKPYVRAVQREGVIASVRPFGFYQQETNRKIMDVEVSEKVAWELYYPPFEAAVQAGASGMTCSTAKVNGTIGCQNSKLLKHDLKGTMGFKGFVMSEESLPSVAPAYENGLDMNMPGSPDHKVLVSNLGSSSAEARQEAATNVLASLYRGRVDELPMWQPEFGTSSQISNQRTKDNVNLAKEAAAAAVTLLKNDGVLPLDPSSVKRIVVLGSAASTPPKVAFWNADYYSGGGSSHIPASNGIEATALSQITRRAADAKITVKSSSSNADIKAAQELAKNADVVIVVAATTSTEGSDRSSLALDDNVDSLIAAVAPLKPTVVLMQTPGAVLTPWRNDVAAAANLFLAGEATGAAWASMLFGDTTPAGKLPLAMPKSEDDTIRPKSDSLVRYTEGLRTSYRSNTLAAAFHFGHGLSYTEFAYSAAQVMGRGCLARACIRLEVSNTGSRPGSEVVQAYLQFDASENMPTRMLRSFHKTGVIRPGQKEEVFLVLTARDLSTYHPDSGWVEQSNVKVDIGSSSVDIRQSVWVNVAVTVDTY